MKTTVVIKEKRGGGTIVAIRGGEEHAGTWNDNGNVKAIAGSDSFMAACLSAWSGQKSPFTLTDEELINTGYWEP